MDNQFLFTMVITLFSVLIALVGWLGARMLNRLDELTATVSASTAELNVKINTANNNIQEKLNSIDKRVVRLEAFAIKE